MKYVIYEQVETVSWTEALSKAPPDMVKTAKEMTEKAEIVVFAKAPSPQVGYFNWLLLTVNDQNTLVVLKRDHSAIFETL